VRKYKGKGGYSGEGLVGTEGNIMFLNYMMKKIVKTKFIHMIHSFFTPLTCITITLKINFLFVRLQSSIIPQYIDTLSDVLKLN